MILMEVVVLLTIMVIVGRVACRRCRGESGEKKE